MRVSTKTGKGIINIHQALTLSMVAIIGAGINGLALAHQLAKENVPYTVFEKGKTVGGYIQSETVEGYELEYGPNSLLSDTETDAFLAEIGLESIPAAEVSKHRFIFRNGKYRKLPSSPPSLLFNNFFSWQSKWAIFSELRNKSKGKPNETLAEFFERRFSKEIVDYPLNTFVAGIYAGDPKQLLVHKTFPILKEYEDQHGSVIRGAMKNKTGERKRSLTFPEGMASLPKKIAEGLNIRLETSVESIQKNEDATYTLHLSSGEQIAATQIVLSLPTSKAADLVKDFAPQYAAALHNINYPPMAVVHSAYPKAAVGMNLNGFGGLHPQKEGLFAAGSIWSSSVFPHKAPSDHVLLTTFVGGMLYADRARLSETEILERTIGELRKVYQIKEEPTFTRFSRWEKAIPQYDKNILPVHEIAESEEKNGLWVAANWKDGISIADGIKKRIRIAEKIKSYYLCSQTYTSTKDSE